MAVSDGDAGLAARAQYADGHAAQPGHHTGHVSRPDQRLILPVGHAADPVKPVSYLPAAAPPGRRDWHRGRWS